MNGRKLLPTTDAVDLTNSSFIADCHSHFLINRTLFGRNFDHAGKGPRFYNPFSNSLSLNNIKNGNVGLLAFTCYVPGRPWFRRTNQSVLKQVRHYRSIVAASRGSLAHCNTAAEVAGARARGMTATMLAVEGGHTIEGDLENLELFHSEGIRMLTLTHFVSNGLCDSAQSPWRPLNGLSQFGRQVIRTMNQLGIIVDVAHATHRAIGQVLDVSDAPVICSHTALTRFKNIERNLSDDLVRAIAGHGGLIGIIWFPRYLGKSGRGAASVARQAAVVAELTSPGHVCLGSDADGFTWLPAGMRSHADISQITQALLDEGFSANEVRGVLGENFMRFFSSVCSG